MYHEFCRFLHWIILQYSQHLMLYMNMNKQYWEERFKKFIVQMQIEEGFFLLNDMKS